MIKTAERKSRFLPTACDSHPRRGTRFRTTCSFIGACSLFALGGCSLSNDTTELSQVQSAASSYRSVIDTLANPPSAAAESTRLLGAALLFNSAPVALDQSCGNAFATKYENYTSSLEQSQAAQDQTYQAMIASVRPCGALSPPVAKEPKLPGAPRAAIRKAAEPRAETQTKLDDVAKALQQYFDNVEAIASSSSITDINNGLSSISSSAQSLAGALKAPAFVTPSLNLFTKAAGVALQEMQYQALRQVVVKVDPLLSAAAPSLEASLRLKQGRNLQAAGDAASVSAALLEDVLNNARVMKEPALRLETYSALRPSLDDANNIYISMSKEDPGEIVAQLVKAHHQLAVSLQTNKHQTKGALAAAASLGEAGKAVVDAAAKK